MLKKQLVENIRELVSIIVHEERVKMNMYCIDPVKMKESCDGDVNSDCEVCKDEYYNKEYEEMLKKYGGIK